MAARPRLNGVTALLGIATRMKLARLLLITDLRTEGDLPDFVGSTVRAGADIVQLRDPGATDAELAAGFESAREAASQRQALLGVYDTLEVSRRVRTDVLHLSERGADASKARGWVHEWTQLGRSCHSRWQVDTALADPEVNYLTIGPVEGLFGASGLDLVEYAALRAPQSEPESKPWFAVGGVALHNLDAIFGAGARRIAVSRVVTDAPDPAAATQELKRRLVQLWKDDPGMEKVIFGAF